MTVPKPTYNKYTLPWFTRLGLLLLWILGERAYIQEVYSKVEYINKIREREFNEKIKRIKENPNSHKITNPLSIPSLVEQCVNQWNLNQSEYIVKASVSKQPDYNNPYNYFYVVRIGYASIEDYNNLRYLTTIHMYPQYGLDLQSLNGIGIKAWREALIQECKRKFIKANIDPWFITDPENVLKPIPKRGEYLPF